MLQIEKKCLEDRPERDGLVAVLCLTIAALVIRLLLLGRVAVIETDGAYYGYLARMVRQGGFLEALNPAWPPLFPALTGIAAALTGDLEFSGGLVSALCGGFLVPVIYLLGIRTVGKEAGILGAFITAFHPRLILYSELYLTESLYTLLFAVSLLVFSIAVSRQRRFLYFLCGLSFALLYTARPDGVVSAAGVLLFLVLPLCRKSRSGWKSRSAALLFIAGAAVLILPYFTALKERTGALSPGEKARYNFHLTYRGEYRRAGIDVVRGPINRMPPYSVREDRNIDRGRRELPAHEPKRTSPSDYRVAEFLKVRYSAVFAHTARTFFVNLFDKLPGAHYHVLFVFAVLGLFFRRRRSSDEILWAALILLSILAFSIYFPLRRFFISFVPLLNIWAACGILFVTKRVFLLSGGLSAGGVSWRMRKRKEAVTVFLVMLGLTAVLYSAGSVRSRDYPTEYRQAGLWLKGWGGKGVVVSARKPEVAFYAECDFVPLPHLGPTEIDPWMEKEGVTHLFLDERVIPRTRVELIPLLDEDLIPSSLIAVYHGGGKGRRTLILERSPAAE
ncbi:MAG: glycosyltransferase family 39 protein [Candidatus Krumholzibacteria bacterium]|nr:glycosyltransferase family 39 protein [Candidatus Krumholzibacteria bacterium]